MQIQYISSKPEKNTHPDKVHAWSELWHLNLFCFSGICHPWFIQGLYLQITWTFDIHYQFCFPPLSAKMMHEPWGQTLERVKKCERLKSDWSAGDWWLDWIINLVPIPRIGLVNKLDTLSKGNFLFQLSSNSLHRKEGTQKWMKFRFIVIENSNL